jgi:hypothetical protein
MDKWFFMKAVDALEDFAVINNGPLTGLLRDLKNLLSERYMMKEKAGFKLASFVAPDEYEKLKYNHDSIIKLFDKALDLSWPENDRNYEPRIVRSNSEEAVIELGTKRSRTNYENGASTSTGGSKRLTVGSVSYA